MSIAEQKMELLRLIVEADEETTTKLIYFFKNIDAEADEFSEKDIAEFERRREEFLKNPDSAISWEESLSRLRNKIAQ